jgi:serine/threonine-protein kinase
VKSIEERPVEQQPVEQQNERPLGRYQLLRSLGAGGMAELYLTKATGTDGFAKHVALKRILPHLASDWRLCHMFLSEARLAALLDHPNIARVYDIGRVGSSYFYTLEYVHGVDLRALWDRAESRGEKVPLAESLFIVAAVARALHYAHEKKSSDGKPLEIVHCDISPPNILVGSDGAIRLTDFGVARAAMRNEINPGALRGKVSYMSPEQCRGEPLDRRGDIFSLGIILYELLLGERLFQGSELMVLRRIVERDVAVDETQLHPELARIVKKALAREVDHRYPSAQALELELDAFARHERLEWSQVALGRSVQDWFGDEITGSEEMREDEVLEGVDVEVDLALEEARFIERRAALSAKSSG